MVNKFGNAQRFNQMFNQLNYLPIMITGMTYRQHYNEEQVDQSLNLSKPSYRCHFIKNVL